MLQKKIDIEGVFELNFKYELKIVNILCKSDFGILCTTECNELDEIVKIECNDLDDNENKQIQIWNNNTLNSIIIGNLISIEQLLIKLLSIKKHSKLKLIIFENNLSISKQIWCDEYLQIFVRRFNKIGLNDYIQMSQNKSMYNLITEPINK